MTAPLKVGDAVVHRLSARRGVIIAIHGEYAWVNFFGVGLQTQPLELLYLWGPT